MMRSRSVLRPGCPTSCEPARGRAGATGDAANDRFLGWPNGCEYLQLVIPEPRYNICFFRFRRGTNAKRSPPRRDCTLQRRQPTHAVCGSTMFRVISVLLIAKEIHAELSTPVLTPQLPTLRQATFLPKEPKKKKCPAPYDDCTAARCCDTTEDENGVPTFVCSTLVLPSTHYRCYHYKEIAEIGSSSEPVSKKLEARLKSELNTFVNADETCVGCLRAVATHTMINCSRNHLNRVAPFTLLQHRVASSDLHLLIISCVVLVAVCIVAGCVVVRLHAAYRKRLSRNSSSTDHLNNLFYASF